jgi:pyruvate-formate lyase-activating enzyme
LIRYDFANILFAGPCNRFCPWCIGKKLPERVNFSNLGVRPLRNLEGFIARVNEERVPEVVFTGTTTDPHLYRYEGELLEELRLRLHPEARISIHTNGVLTLAKLSIFNLYDRATISFPSFDSATYETLMGSRHVPDLAGILERATIPVKVSAVVNEHHEPGVEEFLERCRGIGVRRLVLRRLLGDTRPWPSFLGLHPAGQYRGNPVMGFSGMEVTLWSFEASTCRSLNLFADGTLGTSYLLTETPELRGEPGAAAAPPPPVRGKPCVRSCSSDSASPPRPGSRC